MMELVTIRFTTCRSTLTTAHYSGLEYRVSPAFARQVVDVERCAEYVQLVQESPEAGGRPGRKKA